MPRETAIYTYIWSSGAPRNAQNSPNKKMGQGRGRKKSRRRANKMREVAEENREEREWEKVRSPLFEEVYQQ